MDFAKEIEEIKNQMAKIEVLIKETRDRLPAHSTKPMIMMELLDHEDAYERLAARLALIRKKAKQRQSQDPKPC
ncbi:MAG: hypothetical protein HUK40_13780 [Desulfobacter sp.]|nr:hypothetical protein [Desulfobacter sp.]WDP87778.1 MAG: hypothetical protein HUN05_23750 [Desulfobacter sp.]